MSIAEKLTTIAENQQRVYDAGYAKGQAEGGGINYDEVYNEGYNDGYVAGETVGDAKNAEILADCNTQLQKKGVESAESLGQVPQRIGEIEVAEELFFTNKGAMYKRNMVIPSVEQFYGSAYTRAEKMETVEVPNMDAGTSSTQGVFSFCSALKTAYLPKIRRIGNQFFYSCRALEELTLGCAEVPMVQINATSLQYCNALVRFNLVGAVETSFSLAQSALLDDVSIQNIVDSLADLSGKTAQTLTLHGDVGAKLTDEQKATITAKNWTLVY